MKYVDLLKDNWRDNEEKTREIYNWLQYFSPDDLEKEFNEAGFSFKGIYSNVAGAPYDQTADEFAVVAKKA
jgi:uncharacterized damage-inducible protein DinB